MAERSVEHRQILLISPQPITENDRTVWRRPWQA